MCSFLVQIVYGVVCFVATAMTITSMITPGWTAYTFDVNYTNADISQGILPFTCAYPDEKPQAGLVFDWSDCETWFNNLPWTEKTVVACMCIGLAFQLVAFVWNIISICACCCKKYILHPLSIFTLLAVIFLAIAVAFYAIFNGVDWIDLNSNNPIGVPDLAKGYSFWLACGALVLNVVNMIVASAALCCAKGCC
ncbi:clc-1 [Pristionchus pacificus]|uniref:Clc-1 n=1 Tax=Pristionchus pacificus TaxID=54126 RepID=A0A454XTH5_PRIPA|nr:clc-1 [Pristionchus pacificus]|eukprot:PDM74470.1 clc-1 [Pristionchus pacificus]